MRISVLLTALVLTACAPPPSELAVTAERGALSDTSNLCATHPTSSNVTLPKDYAMHYTLAPLNSGTTSPFGGNGDIGTAFESTFKFWHMNALPVDASGHPTGGPLVRIGGFRAHFAVFTFSPFTNTFDWIKLLLIELVGPDGTQHQWLFLAPGQYAPGSNGYDLEIGSDFITLSVTPTGFVPVAFGGPAFATAIQNGGGNTVDTIDLTNVGGAGFKISSTETPLKNPNYPFHDGFGEYRDVVTHELLANGYYWSRSLLGSAVDITYNGQRYFAAGTSWEERQWPGSGNQKWNWTSIQVAGCKDSHGNIQLNCPYAGDTLAAFDITSLTTGNSTMHSLNTVSAPPACAVDDLFGVSDWTLSETSHYVSARSGVTYANKVHLSVPSRHVELDVTPVINDQETYLAAFAFPGTWEGDCKVDGTINGQHVFGDAFLEQFNKH